MLETVTALMTSTVKRRMGWPVKNGLLVCSAGLMMTTLYMIFLWVPTEQNLGVSQRIFYLHVSLAWIGMISIVAVAFASAMYLTTRKHRWDNLAHSIAELGVVFISLLLISGIIWSKPVWGIWWTWDARLTTTLILWFIYVSYLMLRAYGPKGSQGARYGSIIALIGAIDTPIIYMATVWWRTAHPELNIGPLAQSGGLDSEMRLTLWISVITFAVFYVYILIERYSLKRLEAEIDELYQHVT